MKILITGSEGFIGSHLYDKLTDEGNVVFGIDDLSGGADLYDHKFYQRDCRSAKEIDDIFKIERPEVVYHLAANAAESKAQFSPIDITSRNYDAFIKVLTPFIKYGGKRFIFTSSIAAYGSLQTPFKETDKPEPEDLYGVNKLAIEKTIKIMSKVHGFEYVIVRPHNVYGPRQNMRDPYRNVVTIWMNSLLRGKPIFIYGNGEQKRCFTYVDDVVDALVSCLKEEVEGMTFNVGSDNIYSLNELAQYITGDVIPIHLAKRPQEVAEAVSDHTLSKRYLGYADRTTLEKGIKKTWEWCRAQGPQEPIYTEVEIESDKLPLNWKP